MTNLDLNITLHLVRLKMELDKEHIRYCLLFCFHQKKSAADAHKIICETNIYMVNKNFIKMSLKWKLI